MSAGQSAYVAGRVTYTDNQGRRWVVEATYEIWGTGEIRPVHVGVPEILQEPDPDDH